MLLTWDSEKNTQDPEIEKLVSLDYDRNGTRVNDGKCDPAGRLVIGICITTY